MIELPKWDGWTIDVRLRQFRKVIEDPNYIPGIRFIDFDSDEGRTIFREYCDARDEYYNEISSDYRRLSMELEDGDIDMDTLDILAEEMIRGVDNG